MKKKRRVKRIAILLCTFLLVFTFAIYLIERFVIAGAGDIVHSCAETRMFEVMNECIHAVIQKHSLNYGSLVDIHYSNDGKIDSIQVNYAVVDMIKSELSVMISQELEDENKNTVQIAAGTFTNRLFLVGKGPKIDLMLVPRGCVFTDFEQSFESAGINQTMHTLSIRIKSDVAILLPFYNASTYMDTSVILAQTIINGECPSQYIGIHKGVTTNDR